MPEEDEQSGGRQDGGQGGDQGESGNRSDDPGEFQLGYEIKELKPRGETRKAAPDSDEPEPKGAPAPDPDDPGEFEVKSLTEEERRRPIP